MNTETGSSLYYSLLWTDESARARYVNRLHLIQALNSTLDDVQDPQVAQKKIHWWHEEIERMISTEARHPATKACQSDIPHDKEAALELHTLVSSACLAILSSVSNVRYTPPATDDERNEQLRNTNNCLVYQHCFTEDNLFLVPQTTKPIISHQKTWPQVFE